MGQNFATRPVSRWTTVGITTTCREDTAMRDDPAAKAKSVLGDNISGPNHDARITSQYGRYGLEIQINFLEKKGQSLVWSCRYVAEVSARCNEFMYPETVTLQNASSSTERTVEETTLATRSTRPARSSGKSTTASCHKLTQKSCSRCKNSAFPQNEAWRDSTLQQMTSPIPNGFPVKKVPMKDISMESMLE